jgi:hypothetical protein
MVQEGQTFLYPSTRDNKLIEVEEVGSEDSAFFEPGEGEVELSERAGDFGTTGDLEKLRGEIEPEKIHMRRSETAKIADESKDAEVTTDPLEWASDPSRYDYPGVDTGPRFDETFDGDFADF